MSNRNIPEAAVIALVTGKIEAINRRIDRISAKPDPLSRIDLNMLVGLNAQASALQTVISHLRFIVIDEDRGTIRDHVGGEFPMRAGESLLSKGDR